MDETATAIIESSDYVTLATADADGVPWATPVWFAPDDEHQTFLWVSKPGARHSQNIAIRAEIALSVFDSHATIGQGQGVYMEATARMLTGDEAAHAIGTFSARSTARGGVTWSVADLEGRVRLYAARVTKAWILDGFDNRVPA